MKRSRHELVKIENELVGNRVKVPNIEQDIKPLKINRRRKRRRVSRVIEDSDSSDLEDLDYNPLDSDDSSVSSTYSSLGDEDKDICQDDDNENIFQEKEKEKERRYFSNLSSDEQAKLRQLEKEIKLHVSSDIPEKYQILKSDMPFDAKKKYYLLQERIQDMDKSSDDYAKCRRMLEAVLAIPWGRYHQNSQFDNLAEELSNVIDDIHNQIYGHDQTIRMIIEKICQGVNQPEQRGFVFGLVGPPGVGKTKICKNIVAKTLGRKFYHISLGGMKESSNFDGSDPVYIGATYGRIVQALIELGEMDPVFYFDELDKVDQRAVMDFFVNLTDPEQNSVFYDNFLGVRVDLSRAVFVFSWNETKDIRRELLDRITVIPVNGYTNQQKVEIVQRHILPDILLQYNFSSEQLIFSNDVILYIIKKYVEKSPGMRRCYQLIEQIIAKINVMRLLEQSKTTNRVMETVKPSEVMNSGKTVKTIRNYYSCKEFILPMVVTKKKIDELMRC